MNNLIRKIGTVTNNFSPFASNFSPSWGFTIVELLVTVTLIGVVSGIGIFSLVNYGNAQAIEQSARSIAVMFDEAKFNSISSVKFEINENGTRTSCTDDLAGYMVDVIPSAVEGIPDKLTMFMECESTTTAIKTYTLSGGLSLGSGTLCDTVSYEAVHVNASAVPFLPCDIVVEGFGQAKTITLDTLGNANVN